MSLKQRLGDDMRAAMKGGEKRRLAVIRLINAAIKQREVDERIVLDDAQVLAVLEKMLKQRRDSITQFDAAGRSDLADNERFEVELIQAYLPEPLDEAGVDALIAACIARTGAVGTQDLGKVMAALKAEVRGRADMAKVSARVRARLAG